MADSELRQRKPVEAKEPEKEVAQDSPVGTPKKKKTRRPRAHDEEDAYSPYLDILRVLSFLFVASCGLSYVISGGDSLWWGRKHTPEVLTVDYWKEWIKGPEPPIYLTPDELQRYDGTDAELPVYIGLNGTIYDVTNGRHIYGPGGSYNVFAGVDAARAFVTGCFKDDRTPDMRNVELMFLPLDDPETDAHWTEDELAALRVEELAKAKQRVHDALLHWVNFFGNSRKYKKVGYLVREDGWLEKEPLKELCPPAHKGRKKRVVPAPSEPKN